MRPTTRRGRSGRKARSTVADDLDDDLESDDDYADGVDVDDTVDVDSLDVIGDDDDDDDVVEPEEAAGESKAVDEDEDDENEDDENADDEAADDAEKDGEDEDDVVVDDEDEEEEEDESVQSLDVLLIPDVPAGRTRRQSTPAVEAADRIREGEFTCRSCFLVKKRAQLADPEGLICLDCA